MKIGGRFQLAKELRELLEYLYVQSTQPHSSGTALQMDMQEGTDRAQSSWRGRQVSGRVTAARQGGSPRSERTEARSQV